MLDEQDYMDIQRYLENEMSAKEVKAFEQRLCTDSELRKCLSLINDIDIAIENKEIIEYMDMVKRIMNEEKG
jgi:hypothetical protein